MLKKLNEYEDEEPNLGDKFIDMVIILVPFFLLISIFAITFILSPV